MFANVVLESLDGIYAMGNAHVVIHQRIFARGKSKHSLTRFKGMQVLNHMLVMRHKSKRARHLAKHHGLAPENFGTLIRVHAGIVHTVTATNHKSPKAYFFHRFHESALLVPHRRIPAASAKGFCHLHNPFGLDFGRFVEEDATRFADFGAE